MNEELYAKRERMLEDAMALKEPEELPVIPLCGGLPFFLSEDGTTYKDARYNFDKAVNAMLKFYSDFQPDAAFGVVASGKSNEIAESTMLDWPGRPGTSVPDFSMHQTLEREYMHREEYKELLTDFTGFMMRKYIPRAFPGLKGFEKFSLIPFSIIGTRILGGINTPEIREAYDKLGEIALCEQEAARANARLMQGATDLGIPPYFMLVGEVPFDIISDFYRGTMAMFDDQVEVPDLVAEACDMFADMQIEAYRSMKDLPLPTRRIFFPLHKGMDSFMSDETYRTLYWKPFQKMIDALVAMDYTPLVYSEGAYTTRVPVLKENLPPGKCIVHFEQGDFEYFKRELADVACISGGLHLSLLEWGTPQQIVERVKWLIDTCAPGGGYIMMSSGTIEDAPRENMEALMETARTYGKK